MNIKNNLKSTWQKFLDFCDEYAPYITVFVITAILIVAFSAIALFSQQHCPNCSQQISSSAIYCPNCGHQHLPTCNHCGEALAETDSFCSHCGTLVAAMSPLE